MALFSTITDDFEDGVVGATWEGSSAEVVESGGRARIPSATGYPSLRTPSAHSLVGSSVFVQAYPAPVGTSTTGVTSEMLIDSPTGGTRLIIVVNMQSNQIQFRSDVGYGDGSGVALTYDPSAHRWWRMREDAGQVYMETSPDAATWTIQRQVATPDWITTGNNPLVFSTHREDGDLTYYFEVDNVNLNPAPATIPATPTNVAVDPADTQASISWAGDSQASSYEIEYLEVATTDPVVEGPIVTDYTVQPWTPVTLTSSETGDWTQTKGNALALGGTGATRTFTAPPSMSDQILEFAFGNKVFTVTVPRASHGIKRSDGSISPIRFSNKNLSGLSPVTIDAGISADTKLFTASTEMFANPERGWYQYTQTRWSDATGTGHSPLVATDITSKMTTNETVNGYSVPPRSIVFRYYIMEHMKGVDTLPPEFLTALQNDFDAVRTAGAKMLIRFCYSDDGTTGSNTDGAGPYGTDTTPARTLGHVSQLKSTMNANADVVHAVQAGFIGTWGEWYYTDNWGNKGTLTTTDWANRVQLINDLLDWNVNMPVLLRYVGLKRRYLREGNTYPHAVERLGFHNDAFQASADDSDWGTFNTFADGMTVAEARNYLATEVARPVPMVGETAGVSTRSTYASTVTSLAQHRWSALNPNYHPDVLMSWSAAEKDEVSRKLGYRLRLESFKLQATGTAGNSVPVEFSIVNDGWGNPTSKRPIQIVFDDGVTTVTRTLAKDIRTLGPGQHIVSETIALPGTDGTYNVYLAMPDANAGLATRSEYAIRLANTTTWASGRNNLGMTVAVSGGTASTEPSTVTISADTADAGTFTTNLAPDAADLGTFSSGLSVDTADAGTFVLTTETSTLTISPDTADAGTFTTNLPVDSSDTGTFGAGLTADTADLGTFVTTVAEPAPSTTTGGTGGEFTDQVDAQFAGSADTSTYHLYASTVSQTDAMPLFVHLHGDGANDYSNRTGSQADYLTVAKNYGGLLLVPRTPDNVAPEGWYQDPRYIQWFAELLDDIYNKYNVDLEQVYVSGYSAGAEGQSYYMHAKHPNKFLKGASMLLGGGGIGDGWTFVESTPEYKSDVILRWVAGANDTAANSTIGFDAVAASQKGHDAYQTRGHNVGRKILPILDHYQSQPHGPFEWDNIVREARTLHGQTLATKFMKPATFTNLATRTIASATADKTIGRPLNVGSGDVMLMVMAVYGTNAATAALPPEFTLLSTHTRNTSHTVFVGYRIPTLITNEPTTYTPVIPSGCAYRGDLLAYDNSDVIRLGTPVQTTTAATVGNHPAPSITPTTDNGILVCWASGGGGNTWTPPAGMTERTDYAEAASYVTLTVAEQAITGTTATGVKNFVNSSGAYSQVTGSVFIPSLGSL